jgi:hypothetical protein
MAYGVGHGQDACRAQGVRICRGRIKSLVSKLKLPYLLSEQA